MARTSGQWGWIAASGVIGVVVGILALILPVPTAVFAAVVAGIALIVQGIVEVVAALRGGAGATGRGWLLAFGVLTLLAGILVIFGGVAVLAWALVLWFLVAGINDIAAAGSGRDHRVWNIVVGVISILVAIFLLFSPVTAVVTIGVFIGLGFLLRGAADIGLAADMRRAAR